jgi:hypothetical protein
MFLLAPRSLLSCSALKNSMYEPLANLYVNSVLFQLLSTYLPVQSITFKKSLIAPRLKCGIVSLTTLISSLGVLAALSIKIGSIPNVLPAD